MRWLVLLLLLVACAAPVTTTSQPVAMASPTVLTPTPPLVATRDPQFTPRPLPTFSAPTANASEGQSASNTRLYLTAFQSGNVSEIDPISGHVLHEFSV